MTHIDETLRKLAAGAGKASTTTSSNAEPAFTGEGDPNCPICHGVGFVKQDLPISHPDFGKISVCSCRQREVAQQVHSRLQKLSNLQGYTQMTFESFSTQGRHGLPKPQVDSLIFAHKQARTYAEHLDGWLLLSGGFGTGKTHLAAAIANFALAHGVETIFLTVPDLLDWLRYSYQSKDETFEDRFEELRNAHLLVLDDLGAQNATGWAEEKIFQIINYRYLNRLPTVITTNTDLDDLDGRISSRLQDADRVTLIRINAPDYRAAMRENVHPLLSTLELHANRTFDTFSLRQDEMLPADQRENLSKALRRAQTYAENPRGWLVFIGDYGTGKTHLAAAIGNYLMAKGGQSILVPVADLLDELRATYDKSSRNSYDMLFEQVRTCPLLILDDLGTVNATPWALEKLRQIFNYRSVAELPTVITTTQPLERMDPALAARMLNGQFVTVFELIVPPYRAVPGGEKRRKTPRGKFVAGT